MTQLGVIAASQKQALFLTIYLHHALINDHLLKCCVSELHSLLQSDPQTANSAICFGQETLKRLNISAKPFIYKERTYSHGSLPATGGDIFIHVKGDDRGILFKAAIEIMKLIPSDWVSSFEDIYGFTFLDSRDLTGFIDGINNPKDEEDRVLHGVDPETNGSYVITQVWKHDFKKIASMSVDSKEKCVGRELVSGAELHNKPTYSHVARMKGGTGYQQKPKYRIVRHSLPYGTVSGGAGLFFLAYSREIESFEFMLDRMIEPDHEDGLLQMTRALRGNYWFAPSRKVLESLAKK